MEKRGVLLIVLIMALLALAAGICFGFTTYSGSYVFNNALHTSGVDVKIEASGGGVVKPGEIADYSPKITNLNADSFVRVRFDAEPEEVFGLEKGWVKKGNCYYYKTPLTKGESIGVMSRIRMPENISDELSAYKIKATVDAIQAKNFQPDFDSISPWGTIKIEQTKKQAKDQVVSMAMQMTSPDFNYASPGTFECSTEDLFSNFENFQPGDTYSEMLNMRNNSGRKMSVHFRTDNQKTELLEEMKLLISCSGNKVYEGSLSSEKLQSFIEIANIENGKAGCLKFQISMPETAENQYSMLKDNVTWIIAVKEEAAESNESVSEEETATGDDMKLLGLMVLIAAALTGMIIILAGKCRRNRR